MSLRAQLVRATRSALSSGVSVTTLVGPVAPPMSAGILTAPAATMASHKPKKIGRTASLEAELSASRDASAGHCTKPSVSADPYLAAVVRGSAAKKTAAESAAAARDMYKGVPFGSIPVAALPYLTFTRLGVAPHIWPRLHEAGFRHPTAIQLAALPHLLPPRSHTQGYTPPPTVAQLSGRALPTHYDVILQDMTGSGKSLAYLIPALQSVDVEHNTTQVIVVCPTRELCVQTYNTAAALAEAAATKRGRIRVLRVGGSVSSVLGAQSPFGQPETVPHIVVTTPKLLSQMLMATNRERGHSNPKGRHTGSSRRMTRTARRNAARSSDDAVLAAATTPEELAELGFTTKEINRFMLLQEQKRADLVGNARGPGKGSAGGGPAGSAANKDDEELAARVRAAQSAARAPQRVRVLGGGDVRMIDISRDDMERADFILTGDDEEAYTAARTAEERAAVVRRARLRAAVAAQLRRAGAERRRAQLAALEEDATGENNDLFGGFMAQAVAETGSQGERARDVASSSSGAAAPAATTSMSAGGNMGSGDAAELTLDEVRVSEAASRRSRAAAAAEAAAEAKADAEAEAEEDADDALDADDADVDDADDGNYDFSSPLGTGAAAEAGPVADELDARLVVEDAEDADAEAAVEFNPLALSSVAGASPASFLSRYSLGLYADERAAVRRRLREPPGLTQRMPDGSVLRRFDMRHVRTVVVDEADYALQGGHWRHTMLLLLFAQEVRRHQTATGLRGLPKPTSAWPYVVAPLRMVWTSATVTPLLLRVAAEALHNPHVVTAREVSAQPGASPQNFASSAASLFDPVALTEQTAAAAAAAAAATGGNDAAAATAAAAAEEARIPSRAVQGWGKFTSPLLQANIKRIITAQRGRLLPSTVRHAVLPVALPQRLYAARMDPPEEADVTRWLNRAANAAADAADAAVGSAHRGPVSHRTREVAEAAAARAATAATVPAEMADWHRTQQHDANLVARLYAALEPKCLLVFVNEHVSVPMLASLLRAKGFSVGALTQGSHRAERRDVLAAARRGEIRIVVATNIVARGVDTAGISCVVNLGTPLDPWTYVHRAGRVDRMRSQQQRALVLTVVHTPPAPAGAGPRPHEAVRQMLREEMLDEHVDDPEANVPANDAVGAAAAEADPDADLAAVTTAAADAAEAGGAATDAAEAAQWEAGLYSELGASASAEIAAPEDDDAGPSVLSQVLPTLPRHDRALLRAVAAVAAVEFHPTVLVHGNVLDLETSSVIRARPRRFVALPGAAPGTAPVPEESVAAVQAELEAAAAARAEAEAAAEAAATAAPKRASGVLRPASRRSALGIDRAELARPAARAEEAQETEPAAVAPALVRRASAAEISAETAAIIASASASAAEANLSYSIDSGVSASAGYTSTLLGWQAGQPFLPSGDLAHSAAAAAAVSATAAVRVSAAELDAMAGALSVARGDTPLDAPWVRGQSPALRALEDAAVLGGRPMPVVAATGGDIDADADAGGADGSGEVDLSDPEARARWLLARAEIKRAARAARRERKEANAAARTTAEQAEALLQRERNAVRRAKEREAAAAYADRVQAEKDARTDAWSKANRGRQERLLRESGEAPSYEPRERSAERAPRNSSSVGEDTLPSRSRWHNDTRDNRAGSRPSPQRGGNKTDRDAVPTEREARPRRQVDAAPAQRDRGYSLLRGGEYGGAVPQYYGPRGDRSERAQKQAAYDHGEKQRAEERQMRQEEQQEAARRKRSEARAANKPEKIWIPDARDVLFGDSAKPIRKTRV